MKWIAFLVALPLCAAVDGTVINRTTGQPQGGATVSIYKLGEAGMESLETVKSDAAGKFQFQMTPGPGPHLIQAAFEAVTYNKMMPPGTPRTNIVVEVFHSQAKPGDAKVTQHMLLFEPFDGKLVVSENIVYENNGKLTYNDPAGTVKVHLPEATGGKARIMCTAPNGMPIERTPGATKSAGIYSVDFPIKPGETRFQVTYEVPLPSPAVFKGKILHKEGTTRLVTPRGVSLKGEGLTELGREPATQAAIYNLTAKDFQVEIEGTGSLREPAASGDDEGPGIKEVMPRVYTKLPVVLALAFAILLLGFVAHYREGNAKIAEPVAAAATPAKGKRRA
ncbi:MAG: hypothetical protein HYZ37_08395 [Candidatus Solibacter usitatus]|nr:hypothetical protein [Candidatus Solibacter usitatus]